MRISRSDVFVRSESGGEWMEDFLYHFSKNKESKMTTQDIMSAIDGIKPNTVSAVVDNYREMVGLDKISETESDTIVVKASRNPTRSLSCRVAKESIEEETAPIILIMKDHPEVEKDIDSLCRHSGGNKSTSAIIHYLRNMLGPDTVSFTDDSIVDYVNDVRSKYQSDEDDAADELDVGLIGTEPPPDGDSDTAEYFSNGDK